MWLQGFTTEAVRYGDWKLVRDRNNKPLELYNMKDDPQEKKNLAKSNPEKYDELLKLVNAHMKKAKAIPWKRPAKQ